MDLTRLTQIGKVWGTHGIKGELKLSPLTDDLDLFESLEEALLWDGDYNREPLAMEVEKIRPVKDHWLFKFAEIADLTEAEGYKGLGLWVPDEWLAPLEEDEFFVHDLVGAQAFDLNGEPLGEVVDYLERAEQLVFTVREPDGNEFMFPAVEEVMKEFDAQARRLVLDLAPGMRELNRKEPK